MSDWSNVHRSLQQLVTDASSLPETRLAAAVALIHQALERATWTGIYVLRGKVLELGPFVGDPSPHTRIPVGSGLCGLAVTRGENLDVGDVDRHPEYLACSVTTRSEAIALIRHNGRIVGQIDIDSNVPGEFGQVLMTELDRAAVTLAPLVALLV